MTLIADKLKRQPKEQKNMGERLLEIRNQLAAKVPKEAWESVPRDSSTRINQ
jgi:hypothetical protein